MFRGDVNSALSPALADIIQGWPDHVEDQVFHGVDCQHLAQELLGLVQLVAFEGEPETLAKDIQGRAFDHRRRRRRGERLQFRDPSIALVVVKRANGLRRLHPLVDAALDPAQPHQLPLGVQAMAAFRSLGGWKLVTPLPDPKRGHRDAGHARDNADVVDRLFADIPSDGITICVRVHRPPSF